MADLISTKGRYALRVMCDLAQNDGIVPLGAIAKRQGVSRKYLEQVMSLLNKAKLVEGTRGKGGGYRLTREPKDYPLGEILSVAEGGNLSTVACLHNPSKNTCERRDICPTLPIWQGLDEIVNGYLNSRSLADLVEQSAPLS